MEEFTVEHIYNANVIEGNTPTLREADPVLRGLTMDKKPLRDHREAVGRKKAFAYVREAGAAKHAADRAHDADDPFSCAGRQA